MPTLNAGSILLGSPRAAELRAWYHAVLAPDTSDDGPIRLGQLMLVIDQRDDVAIANDEPGRSIVNFHVEDFASAQAQLQEAGVEWIAPPEDRPSGRFATFADPDGNYLQIIQFTQSRH